MYLLQRLDLHQRHHLDEVTASLPIALSPSGLFVFMDVTALLISLGRKKVYLQSLYRDCISHPHSFVVLCNARGFLYVVRWTCVDHVLLTAFDIFLLMWRIYREFAVLSFCICLLFIMSSSDFLLSFLFSLYFFVIVLDNSYGVNNPLVN